MQSIRRNLLLQPSETFETQGILLQILSRFLKHAQHMYEITDTRIWKSIRYIRKNLDQRNKPGYTGSNFMSFERPLYKALQERDENDTRKIHQSEKD